MLLFGHDVIQGGANGLKAARSIAMLSYRTAFGYNEGQRDTGQETDRFRAASYQQYQEKSSLTDLMPIRIMH